MATAPTTPMPPGGAPPGASPTGPSAAPAQNPMKVFAVINQLAQAAAKSFPACSQELSQISDLTQKCMQKAMPQQPQGQGPQAPPL